MCSWGDSLLLYDPCGINQYLPVNEIYATPYISYTKYTEYRIFRPYTVLTRIYLLQILIYI